MLRFAQWTGSALALAFSATMAVTPTEARQLNDRTVLTFGEPIEIPGHVLPAGTYVFRLADSMTDRHIVEVLTADGSKMLATVMAIPGRRLTPTNTTVINFDPVPTGSPQTIRAWFAPGNSVGQEFVYPRARATALAKATGIDVPALPDAEMGSAALRTATIVAVTPEAREVPVTAEARALPAAGAQPSTPGPMPTAPVVNAPPITPVAAPAAPTVAPATTLGTPTPTPPVVAVRTRELPQTAGALPLVGGIGVLLFGLAAMLVVLSRRAAFSEK